MHRYLVVTFLVSGLLQTTPYVPYPSKSSVPQVGLQHCATSYKWVSFSTEIAGGGQFSSFKAGRFFIRITTDIFCYESKRLLDRRAVKKL